MRLRFGALALASLAACLFPDPSPLGSDGGADANGIDAPDDVAVVDAADAGGDADAASPKCDPAKPFESITPIAELNDGDDQYKATLSPDELEIWFGDTHRYDGGNDIQILHASRASTSAPFGTPAAESNLGPGDVDPAVADDALGLYYSKFGTVGNWDLFFTTRSSRTAPFALGAQLPISVQSASSDTASFVASDGLWFASARDAGNNDIYLAPLGDAGLGAPALVSSLSSAGNDSGIVVTHDGLFAYVSSDRGDLGSAGSFDIYLAHRATTADAFGALVNQTELNAPSAERANWISWDNCRLVFESTRNGKQSDLFLATKTP